MNSGSTSERVYKTIPDIYFLFLFLYKVYTMDYEWIHNFIDFIIFSLGTQAAKERSRSEKISPTHPVRRWMLVNSAGRATSHFPLYLLVLG
jgi:hypothetical protein